jgi:GTPase
MISPESDTGPVEYKREVLRGSCLKLAHLTSQMRFRLDEGNGECFYKIGVDDDGSVCGVSSEKLKQTMEVLEQAAQENKFTMYMIAKETLPNNKTLFVADLYVRRQFTTPVNLKVITIGNVDAAKSSTIGCLVFDQLDDGNGHARSQISNYVHEIKSGRTSSIAQHILGFDSNFNTVTVGSGHYRKSWVDIMSQSTKIVTFFDLAGHEKYLKTTIRGMQGSNPDLALIMVAANKGMSAMTYQHIHLCLCLNIKFAFVITKMDLVTKKAKVKARCFGQIKRLLKKPTVGLLPLTVKTKADVILAVKHKNSIAPIFKVSNVTGVGHAVLIQYLQFYTKPAVSHRFQHAELHVDSIFQVTGVGLVIGGQLYSGHLKIGDKVKIGPDSTGNFLQSTIKSIHVKRCLVEEAVSGFYVCVALRSVKRSQIKRGQVLLSQNYVARVVNQFSVRLKVSQGHSTTVAVGFQPVVYVNNLRFTAEIVAIQNSSKILRTGDVATVTFSVKTPVFVKEHDMLIFSSGRVKAFGKIIFLN